MKKTIFAALAVAAIAPATMAENNEKFDYVVDRFADIEVLRYKVPDFENLTPVSYTHLRAHETGT